MHEEAVFYPLENDVVRDSGHAGRSKPLEWENVVGLDFEIDSDGYVRKVFSTDTISYSINNKSDAYSWLAFSSPLAYFVADDRWMDSILKWFGEDIVEEYKRSRDGFRMNIDDLHITYLPNGYASILRGKKTAKKIRCLYPFFHMSRMLSEEDCFSTRDKAVRLIKELGDYGVPQGNLNSPGNILQSFVSQSGIVCDSPGRVEKAVLDMAANCYHTNWITAVRLGHFSKVWDYDISSAYPYHTSQLLSVDPTYGDWRQSSQYQKDAAYGYCKVKVKQYSYLSPLMFRNFCEPQGFGSRRINQRNCAGEWSGWLTKREIDFVVSRGIGKVEIEDGWWFFAQSEFRPFEYSMQKFFDARDKAKSAGDKFMSNLCKLIGVSGQGKFMSSFPSFGNLVGGYMRNPIYAADITAATRVQVGEFCFEREENVLNICVDGVTLDKQVEVLGGTGQFRLESLEIGEECVIAGDGQYWMPSRPSVFQKVTLEKYAGLKEYPNPIALGRHSLGEAATETVAFEKIGKQKEKMPMIEIEQHIGKAQRLFVVKPEKCEDFLNDEFDSVSRVLR